MGFEDFYAAFTADSHPSFSVSPQAGRMDRRGGEPTELVVKCVPNGKAGTFVGNLVINLPEDNSKICYKITATSFWEIKGGLGGNDAVLYTGLKKVYSANDNIVAHS